MRLLAERNQRDPDQHDDGDDQKALKQPPGEWAPARLVRWMIRRLRHAAGLRVCSIRFK